MREGAGWLWEVSIHKRPLRLAGVYPGETVRNQGAARQVSARYGFALWGPAGRAVSVIPSLT
ncbi:hypothetical protein [Diplocloster hominis]|uniref:hypothetical protein n=1 Tax=Diplocloster hominis TaxID=3079010 RepID=UPI0031B9D7C6